MGLISSFIFHEGRHGLFGDNTYIPTILGTPSLLTDDKISGLDSSSLSAREWIHGTIKFLIALVKEMIESFDTTVFNQQNWKKIREKILKEHSNNAWQNLHLNLG